MDKDTNLGIILLRLRQDTLSKLVSFKNDNTVEQLFI